jgi:hypothetical protein
VSEIWAQQLRNNKQQAAEHGPTVSLFIGNSYVTET